MKTTIVGTDFVRTVFLQPKTTITRWVLI